MQDDEERAGHCDEEEEALTEVADALLDDVVDYADGGAGSGLLAGVGDLFGDAEGGGVEGGLGDEAVGEGDTDEAGDTGCQAEQEDVPVEARGFAEGELGTLGNEGRYCRGN